MVLRRGLKGLRSEQKSIGEKRIHLMKSTNKLRASSPHTLCHKAGLYWWLSLCGILCGSLEHG